MLLEFVLDRIPTDLRLELARVLGNHLSGVVQDKGVTEGEIQKDFDAYRRGRRCRQRPPLCGCRESDRLGRFRIVYRISSKGIVEIVAAGCRRSIYEATYRLVRRSGNK